MEKKQDSLVKQIVYHVAAIATFLIITLAYFSPIVDGKVLPQGDTTQFLGSSQEIREYYEQESESSAWLGAMFSGMPAYQIGIYGGSPNFLDYVEAPLKALDSKTAGPVFAGMLMAYILFCVMGLRPSIAVVGAIAYSLSSYNIIILDAGHVTKAWAIAYMPLIIAGLTLLFRKKYMWGGVVMALGLALQIKNNHLQITYYTGLLVGILLIGYIICNFKTKEIKSILGISGIMVGVAIIAVLANAGNFYGNYEMAEESTRGQSELSAPSTSEKQSSGLDKDYAFAWSYGKVETFSLLIPNIYGGASGGMLDKSSNMAKAMRANGFGNQVKPEGVQSHTYWGDQPPTSGPVYFGAVVCFLFVLGMFLIRNNMKWALFAATIAFFFLAWGRNLEWFNDFMFYHFPMYNKFRAVSMGLVIPALTMVMIAVWGLKEFLTEDIDLNKKMKALYIATATMGGLALFFWVAPGFFFDFTSANDMSWKSEMPEWYYTALVLDRKDLLSSDAFRSLMFVLVSAGVLWGSTKIKSSQQTLAIATALTIAVLVLGDLWVIDRRYLDDSKFENKTAFKTRAFPKTPADEFILKDTSPSHRVLNVAVNTFNDATTSYYHKSIGGYHAAKLKRYQEMVEYRLGKEVAFVGNAAQQQLQSTVKGMQERGEAMNPIVIDSIVQTSIAPLFQETTSMNIINTKYVIYHPDLPPVRNPYALGNAWFVPKFDFVSNADKEIESLNELDPLATAVIDIRFDKQLEGLKLVADSTATIAMTEYKPNRVTYTSKTASEQLAVFSEIYYEKGWQAYIDGVEAPHIRADWTLRAMRIPAGEHEIKFVFEPKDYAMCRTVTTASTAILVLLLLGMLAMEVKGRFF